MMDVNKINHIDKEESINTYTLFLDIAYINVC